MVTVAAGGNRTGPASLLVLRDDALEKIWFGVQGDRVDSDLSPMAPELEAGLAERLNWTEVSSSEALRAVLDEGIDDIEAFDAYLQETQGCGIDD